MLERNIRTRLRIWVPIKPTRQAHCHRKNKSHQEPMWKVVCKIIKVWGML